MQPELKVELGFVQRRLPWVIAGVALLVYLGTLNHSPTFAGISSLAKAIGWDWRSNVVAPLHVILTYPVRWLPIGMQLACLNVLAAVVAALALGLLARAVSLLPYDRTREQRAAERSDHSLLSNHSAWIPPVLAALVCGFQLTFWENAVVATGEAFDLLLFAWLVDCLLRYRLDQKESRLTWFAVVYGLAIVNNFGMIGFFPAFLTALFWIKGMAFFNWRFLLRMTLCGLAGLCLYVMVPLIEGTSNLSGYGFWELMRSYWSYQKGGLLGLPRYLVLFCSFTSIVPLIFMGIRWPAQFGEASAAGSALTNLMTHVIHGVFLVACIYVTFDPPFSPRRLTAGTYSMLPFYYLGALVIGYCAGYFLLVFGVKPGPQSWQKPPLLRRVANLTILTLVRIAVVAVPVGLIAQNLPTIWASTGQAMGRLSHRVAESLPPGSAFILSDDAFRLYALEYELRKSQPNHKYILLDTTQLAASGYHAFLLRKHPDVWPKFERPADPKAPVDALVLINLLSVLAARAPIYYLHPSFGYFFEAFYAKPHQLVYELKPFTDPDGVLPPPLTAAEIKELEAYWQSLKASELDPLIQTAPPFVKPSSNKPRSKTLVNYLRELYSRMVNDFGVQIQRSGDVVKAAEYFDLAIRLNPANPSAFLNLDYNQAWQKKTHANFQLTESAKQRLAPFAGRWEFILGVNGPIDEPVSCSLLAERFQQGLNFRQAAQCLERTVFFEPENRIAQIALMMLCVKAQLPDLALKKLAVFRASPGPVPLTEPDQADLFSIEAWANVLKGDLAGAERVLTAAQNQFPKQNAPWDTLSDIYLNLGQVTNAVGVLERQMKEQPQNVRALVNYAGMKLRLDQPSQALIYLNKALELSPKDEAALMNRGLAYLALDQLDAAEQDLYTLYSSGRSTYSLKVLFYLAETQWRKRTNPKLCLQYYKKFIAAAPPGAAEVRQAQERVNLLKGGNAF